MSLRKFDKALLFSSIILFFIGTIMIFSASSATSFMKFDKQSTLFLQRQLAILAVGLIAFVIVIQIPTREYYKLSIVALVAIFAVLLFLLLFGTEVSSAKRSLALIGSFRIQPSEFAKIIGIVFLAAFYDRWRKKPKFSIPVSILAIFSILILIVMQPDLGTSAIFLLVMMSVFFVSPFDKSIKKPLLLLVALVTVLGVLVLFFTDNSYMTADKKARLQPYGACSEEKYYDSGNQLCNGYIAINRGGLTGVGLDKSTQKRMYLPEPHNDFIFPVVLEESGLGAGFVLIALFFLVISRIIAIGKTSNSSLNKMICFGIAVYIFLHIFLNLAGVLGIVAMTGVPLPFISYGGSFTLSLIVALGIVQRISIEKFDKSSKIVKKRK